MTARPGEAPLRAHEMGIHQRYFDLIDEMVDHEGRARRASKSRSGTLFAARPLRGAELLNSAGGLSH